jgi:hypothetical protein
MRKKHGDAVWSLKMKKIAIVCFALLVAFLFSVSRISWAGFVGDSFVDAANAPTIKPRLLIEVKKKKQQGDNGASEEAGSQGGDHACPPGYVVLDKPNKFGAFCEPKEGVCEKGLIGTPPDCKCPDGTLPLGTGDNPCVAKQNCQFPGQEGNPPNCYCPKGTEFVGYKGCVKYSDKSDCEVLSADTLADLQPKMTAFTLRCQKNEGKVHGPEDTIHVGEGEKPMIQLCCVVRYYEK